MSKCYTRLDLQLAKKQLDSKLDLIAEYRCPYLYIQIFISEILTDMDIPDIHGKDGMREKLFSYSMQWLKNLYGEFYI